MREKSGMPQTDVARVLWLYGSSVTTWEMELSVTSTQYIVELAKSFDVSTDYILKLENTSTISVKGLTQKQVAVLLETIECFRESNKK